MLSSDLPKLPCLLYYGIMEAILRKLCVEFEYDILNMIF